MKIELPGQEIASIRHAFGMNVDAFAQVLAVHPSTVKRWEASNPAKVDGVAAGVFAVARHRLHSSPVPDPAVVKAKGDEIASALMAMGALIALVLLIKWLTDQK